MKPIKLKISTKTQKYSIIIGSNLVSNISKISKNNSINFKKCLLVIDKNISKKIISKIKKSLNKTNGFITFDMAISAEQLKSIGFISFAIGTTKKHIGFTSFAIAICAELQTTHWCSCVCHCNKRRTHKNQ